MKLEINGSPIEFARSLKPSELKKIVKSCKSGDYDEFTDRSRVCFEKFLAGDISQAEWWSNHAELVRADR